MSPADLIVSCGGRLLGTATGPRLLYAAVGGTLAALSTLARSPFAGSDPALAAGGALLFGLATSAARKSSRQRGGAGRAGQPVQMHIQAEVARGDDGDCWYVGGERADGCCCANYSPPRDRRARRLRGTPADRAAPAHWGYEGEGQPDQWGRLNPAYAACQKRHFQSPIDLHAVARRLARPLTLDYRPDLLRLVNNGHTVQVQHAGGSTLTIDDRTFTLSQYHVHSPSEHTIDGRRFALEPLQNQEAQQRLAANVFRRIALGEHASTA